MSNKTFLILCCFFLICFPIYSAYALEFNYPAPPGTVPPQQCVKLSNEEAPGCYVQYIIDISIIIAGSLVFIILVIGGIRYLVSFGNPTGVNKAKEQISSAFFGFLIILTSVLLLETINPRLLIMDIPKTSNIPVQEKPYVPPPPLQKVQSSISVQIPFGTIIEKNIFETETKDDSKSRMDRILEISAVSWTLTNKIVKQNEELYDLTKICNCANTTALSSGGCTCDPCSPVRKDIQEKEEENLKDFDDETDVDTTDFTDKVNSKYNSTNYPLLDTIPIELESEELKTNLENEQKRILKEAKSLKEELMKLNRAKDIITQCGLSSVNSLAYYYYTNNVFESLNKNEEIKKWFQDGIKFWNDISIYDSRKRENDWATFYCIVSGNFLSEYELQTSYIDQYKEEDTQNIESNEEHMSCEIVPVGEIIDRSERLASKIIERLETLAGLEKELINAVDQLQVYISQCNSQRCVIQNGGCYGEPCPRAKMEEQIQKIKDMFYGSPKEVDDKEPKNKEGINDVILGTISDELKNDIRKERLEQIGIVSLIEINVPFLLAELNKRVRAPMKECVTDIPPDSLTQNPEQPIIFLSDCASTQGSIVNGKVLEKCCYTEEDFDNCLSQCYLETENDKSVLEKLVGSKKQEIEDRYKKCLNQCLEKKAEEKGIREIGKCQHKINYYCCGK